MRRLTAFEIGVLWCVLASPASAQGAGGLSGVAPPAPHTDDFCYEAGKPGDVPCPPAEPVVRERLYPDDAVREIWQTVTACAGDKRDTTKTLEQVVFLLRDSTYLAGSLLKGEWAPPDTVYLTIGLENEGWVVGHELMHYALNGPPGPPALRHPVELFTRCRLFEHQQHAGGMMGGTRIPTHIPNAFAAASTAQPSR